ncbi:MAG: alpha/beta hydrolase [Acutalibacteraceae bacterium]
MFDQLMKLFWQSVKKNDDKRIATLTMPSGIHESNHQRYLSDGNPYHLLDVYYPENAAEKLPVVIDIHGGGWMYGDKELNKPYCLYLASQGNVVFNISYRLCPEVTAIEQLRDVAAALIWVRDHLADYPCDTDSICLTGDSAGGFLACYTAMLSRSEKMREIFDVSDFGLYISAVGLTSPVTRMDAEFPMNIYTRHMLGKSFKEKKWAPYVNADAILSLGEMPPTFLVTSDGDIPALKQTLYTAELFRKNSIETELLHRQGEAGKKLPHVFPVLYPDSEEGAKATQAMLRFFAAHRRETAAERT